MFQVMSINKSMSSNKKLLSLVKLVKLFVSCIQKCYPSKNFRASAPNPAGGLNAPQTPTCKAPPFTAGYAPDFVMKNLLFACLCVCQFFINFLVCKTYGIKFHTGGIKFHTFLPFENSPYSWVAQVLSKRCYQTLKAVLINGRTKRILGNEVHSENVEERRH